MVILDRVAADRILEHCVREHPEEACGVLVGPCEPGRLPDRITAAFESRNLAPDRCRSYLVDPALQLRLQRELRETGLEVIGVYHSHPHGPACPSDRDRAEAWAQLLYLIVETYSGHTGAAAAFRLVDGRFEPVPLSIAP